jgi:hypothetical protein
VPRRFFRNRLLANRQHFDCKQGLSPVRCFQLALLPVSDFVFFALAVRPAASLPSSAASFGPVIVCVCVCVWRQTVWAHIKMARRPAMTYIVSAPFPSWNRSILTEIYLCHACSYQEIEDGNGAPGGSQDGLT